MAAFFAGSSVTTNEGVTALWRAKQLAAQLQYLIISSDVNGYSLAVYIAYAMPCCDKIVILQRANVTVISTGWPRVEWPWALGGSGHCKSVHNASNNTI